MALEAALVVVLLALPICLVVRWELERLERPAYLREHGIVIVSEHALQGHSAPIGEYRGQPIGPRELLIDPGLVYVTD